VKLTVKFFFPVVHTAGWMASQLSNQQHQNTKYLCVTVNCLISNYFNFNQHCSVVHTLCCVCSGRSISYHTEVLPCVQMYRRCFGLYKSTF